MIRLISLFAIFTLLVSCRETEIERITLLVNEWNGKTIYYPDSMCLISYNVDSVIVKHDRDQSSYTILNYVDSTGCMSCKLQLSRWKKMLEDFDSIFPNKVTCLFAFYPKDKEKLIKHLKKVKFDRFVYIDETDTLNRMNKFINDEKIQTFLLDKNDRVVAIGNPIHIPKIRKLYENIVSGDDISKRTEIQAKTTVGLDRSFIDLEKFNRQQEMQTEFILSNTGNVPLVIMDVTTSCGCTSVEYDKEPVKPGEEMKLIVKYKADEPGYFSKSIKVFCNADESPLLLRITGEALSD